MTMTRLSTTLFSVFTASSLFYGCSSPENAPKTVPPSVDLSQNQLRIPTASDPLSFDPRLVRDLPTANLMQMIFEGLMRTGPNGIPEPAIAKSVTISPDNLTYVFTLRDSKWADGTPLTANDFVETWKSMLSPDFPAPNAYQLYVIKGAKVAKEGKLPLDSIGVSATSPSTLVVQLEQPAPYFLDMVTAHFFFPVNRQMRNQSGKESSPEQIVGNGPFKIAHWKQRNEVATVKNPEYWDAQAVQLNGVTLQILDENTALQLFKTGEIDWAGSPLSTLPQDAIVTLKEQGTLMISPSAGTHWFRFNTQKSPFNNVKMRKAFSMALDRQAIVEHVTQGNQIPAIGIVPPSLGFGQQQYFKDHDIKAAQKLFMAALIDLKDAGQKLPEISLCYSASDRNHKIAQAVQQQWKKAFGIDVALESCESQVLYDKLHGGTYQIASGAWYADIRDPINFLEIFKNKDNSTNNTYWEDQRFADLLNQSALANAADDRKKLLMLAEEVLMDGMPIAPIFHNSFNYLKNDNVDGIYFSELGYLDFKQAHFKAEDNALEPAS